MATYLDRSRFKLQTKQPNSLIDLIDTPQSYIEKALSDMILAEAPVG